MAFVAGARSSIALPLSFGFRIIEQYYTSLHTITENYIDNSATFEQTIYQIRQRLPLNLVLTTGKLVSDIATVGSCGCLIYELFNGLPILVQDLTINRDYHVDEIPRIIQQYFPRLVETDLNPNLDVLNGLINNMFFPDASAGTVSGVDVVERVLLAFTRWIITMVQQVGSLFYVEAMKYLLVVLALFYEIVQNCRRIGQRLINIWRRLTVM